MLSKSNQKLSFHKETLRHLTAGSMEEILGGQLIQAKAEVPGTNGQSTCRLEGSCTTGAAVAPKAAIVVGVN